MSEQCKPQGNLKYAWSPKQVVTNVNKQVVIKQNSLSRSCITELNVDITHNATLPSGDITKDNSSDYMQFLC